MVSVRAWLGFLRGSNEQRNFLVWCSLNGAEAELKIDDEEMTLLTRRGGSEKA